MFGFWYPPIEIGRAELLCFWKAILWTWLIFRSYTEYAYTMGRGWWIDRGVSVLNSSEIIVYVLPTARLRMNVNIFKSQKARSYLQASLPRWKLTRSEDSPRDTRSFLSTSRSSSPNIDITKTSTKECQQRHSLQQTQIINLTTSRTPNLLKARTRTSQKSTSSHHHVLHPKPPNRAKRASNSFIPCISYSAYRIHLFDAEAIQFNSIQDMLFPPPPSQLSYRVLFRFWDLAASFTTFRTVWWGLLVQPS